MEEVRRNGKQMLVPKKISDHIPTVPIFSVDRFEVEEWNENLGLEDEELQIYKTPHSEVYQLHRHRWEFFGKMLCYFSYVSYKIIAGEFVATLPCVVCLM